VDNFGWLVVFRSLVGRAAQPSLFAVLMDLPRSRALNEDFDFILHARNESLAKKGWSHPILKTGTTIAACVFGGGVVLGADTRATAGPIVAVKDEHKIHMITDEIWCLGAGTAADNDNVTELVSANLRLFKLNTAMQPRVEQAATILVNRLFKYGGYISAALIVAGVDFKGPSIYALSPDGSISQAPFISNGSGMYASISVLESRWRPGLSEAEAKELVADAVQAGITNDLGSGSNVNLCVITAKGSDYLENYRVTNQRQFHMIHPITAIGVEVMKETSRPLSLPEVHLEILDGAATSE
jgi:20S proteasome subunit beta 2